MLISYKKQGMKWLFHPLRFSLIICKSKGSKLGIIDPVKDFFYFMLANPAASRECACRDSIIIRC